MVQNVPMDNFSGTSLAKLINDNNDAFLKNHLNITRPSYLGEGGRWLRINNDDSISDMLVLKNGNSLYDHEVNRFSRHDLSPKTVPTGVITSFSGVNPPQGWLVCNGALLKRDQFPQLWKHAQNSGNLYSEVQWFENSQRYRGGFSYGDGKTTFRIPNLSGMFIRGQQGGRSLGWMQGDAFKRHGHNFKGDASGVSSAFAGYMDRGEAYRTSAHESTTSPRTWQWVRIEPNGSDENRPVNIAYPYIIKY